MAYKIRTEYQENIFAIEIPEGQPINVPWILEKGKKKTFETKCNTKINYQS